jgi:hypothetical protein
MVTGGQLRHHSAVFGMKVLLTVKPMRYKAMLRVVDGDSSLVTRCFYTDHTHCMPHTSPMISIFIVEKIIDEFLINQ